MSGVDEKTDPNAEAQMAQPLNIAVDAGSLQVPFVDMIQVEISIENVKLNFLQLLPGSTAENQNTKLIYRLALSWPHFIRFIKLSEDMINGKKDEMKEALIKLVDSL